LTYRLFPKLPLQEIASVERGKFSARPRNDPQFYGGTIPFLQTGDIARARNEITKWDQTLNDRGLAVSRLFPPSTILMSIAANVGDVAVTNFAAACPDSVAAVLPHPNTDKGWLFQTLKMSKPDLAALATQNAQANLSIEKILPFKVHVAPPDEQRRIAEILSAWDQAIEGLNRLIALHKRQYLGLRNEIVDWISGDQLPLNEFLAPTSRPVPKPRSAYRALGIRSHGKGTFSRVVDRPTEVDMDTLYVAKAGDIIVNITFAWEGAIALVPPEHDGCLVSHRFPTYILDPKKVNARYLQHVIRMPRFTYLLGLVSPGGAGRNRVLGKGSFLELKIPMPSVKIQSRIADILDAAETVVSAESRLMNTTISQKKGLMHKLLTGEWRVRLENA
jgi:type I restriction enzyme S subunit